MRTSVQEYLESDRVADLRSEYYDGEVFPVAVSSLRHSVIIGNLVHHLKPTIRDRKCVVGPNTTRVKVGPRKFVYPDVLVLCGKPSYALEDPETITNPKLIIEVLSPSTQGHDWSVKSPLYRKLESLEEFAFVSQEVYSVEVVRRMPDGSWSIVAYEGAQAAVEFASLGASIPLSAVYEDAEPDSAD